MELLCVTAVTELENIYLLTCRDLKQCLHNRGLPMECLPRLYEICGNKE